MEMPNCVSQFMHLAVADGQRQEDSGPTAVVFHERLQSADETRPPCPRSAPLAERAKTTVAKGPTAQLGRPQVLALQGELQSQPL